MNKVLIALDNSSFARNVAEIGYKVAKSMGSQTILLHVISTPSYSPSLHYSPIIGYDNLNNSEVVENDNAQEIKREAMHYLLISKQNLGDQSIQTIVKDGDFADTIIEFSNEIKADLIVMGTHGREGISKFLLGSVAEKVLHRSRIPLLIIPQSNKNN